MLEQYRKKRDFRKTPEPQVERGDPVGTLRFVVQKHSASHLHYDFRLECDGVLKSWAVPKGPSLDPKVRRLAIAVEDHPISYISFEGVIPKGQYGGGEVIVWDTGSYAPVAEDTPREDAEEAVQEGLREGKLTIELFGQKLKGEWTLVHMRDEQWLLVKKDDFAASGSDVTRLSSSVLSGRTNEDLRGASSMPNTVSPMLASEIDKPFTDADWTFELKLDGIRAVSFVKSGKAKIVSRTGNDLSAKFPKIIEELEAIEAEELIADGEIVVFDEGGRPNFQKLMQRPGIVNNGVDAEYCLFDLIFLDGQDLRDLSLRQRRAKLEDLKLHGKRVRLLDSFPKDGVLLYDQVLKLGLEGIVGKRLDSTYRQGARNGDWVKVKKYHSEEFLIAGYTTGEGMRQTTFGALLLAQREGSELRYCGNVGSGFSDQDLDLIRNLLEPTITSESPFGSTFALERKLSDSVHWVRPQTLVEVRSLGWTKDHRLRMPVFIRLRPDMQPSSVPTSPQDHANQELIDRVLSADADFELTVDAQQIKLTHLDKPLWPSHEASPEVRKRDFIAYYLRIAKYLLPQIMDRPLSFVRFPDGITGKSFFQRRWDKNPPPFVETVKVWSDHNGSAVPYVMCNNLATLVWLGQLAALEIHPWYSRAMTDSDAADLSTDFLTKPSLDRSALNYPDFVVFDLDPNIRSGKEAPGKDPDLTLEGWQRTVDVALQLNKMLGSLGLTSYVKTSGKTGLHVFVPVKRIYTYDETRGMAEVIGRHLTKEMPSEVTMEWSLKKRPDKVFFDHNQNVRGKTLAAIYSPRPVAGAPVSFPIAWPDLKRIFPTDFTMLNAPDLAASHDPLWHDILRNGQNFQAA